MLRTTFRKSARSTLATALGAASISACALFGATAAANADSLYTVTMQQVGSDIVASSSNFGSFDLTALSPVSGAFSQSAGVAPVAAQLQLSSGEVVRYSGISGPTGFGPGNTFTITSAAFVMATGEARSTLPLTLGCSGTALNGHANTKITDLSIVVDFDHHTVSGFFWVDLNGFHTPIPITTIDANSIDFHGINKSDLITSSITGSIDRITGTVQASGTTLLQNGNRSVAFYNLQCEPTKRLF